MNIVFVKQGEYEKGDAAFPVITEAVKEFLIMSGKQDASDCTLQRTPEGRPYLTDFDGLDISVTHSGDIWMCLVSDGRCGIDFQYIKGQNVLKKIERYYTEGECEYIEGGGTGQYTGSFLRTEEGRSGRFFDIWVRREALGKYEGHGIFGEYPDSAPGGMLAKSVYFSHDNTEDHKRVYVHDLPVSLLTAAGIKISSDCRAAVVSESDEMPQVIKIV